MSSHESATRRRMSRLAPAGSVAGDPARLAASLRAEQCTRWQAGDRVPAETYFELHPELIAAAEYAVDLVYSEFLLRLELGEDPDPAEYTRRFPQFAAALERQFELHRELNDTPDDALGELDSSGLPAAEPKGGDAAWLPASPPTQLGRFEIKQQLGAGGFGSVYRAFDPQLGRDVALKVPHAHLLSPEHRDRFLREARAAAQLQHPNLVAVYDYAAAPDGCYIAYQFVPGQTLAQVCKSRAVTPHDAAALVRKLAEAAQHAHTKGVYHRDLKTANVLIDPTGEPFISDFGLVRLEGDATLTTDATVLGTPAYMPPEQAIGSSHQADARSDVYTLGIVLYELLTGRVPFDGPAQSVLRQVVEQDPPPLRALNDRVPRELETICLKALSKRPRDRYDSAAELAADLGRWLRHEPIRARPVSLSARALKWARRRPAVAALIALTILGTLTMAVVGSGYSIRLRAANQRSQELLSQTRLLLSQAQAERGVQLLESNDPIGLLHLLEARDSAQDLPRVRDSRALLWAGWFDACAGRLLWVLGNEGDAERVEFSRDSRRLATASKQGAYLWDPATGQAVAGPLPHNRQFPIAFAGDGLFLTIGRDGVQFWDAATGQAAKLKAELPQSVTSAAISPDGNLLAIGSGKHLWVCDLRNGTIESTPFEREDEIGNLLTFSGAARWLAHAGRAGDRYVVTLYRIAGSRAVPAGDDDTIVHSQPIVSMAFSPDQRRLATASWDDTAQLWSVPDGSRVGTALAHQEDVLSVSFSRDGRMLATSSFDGTARLWNAADGAAIGSPLRHQGPVRAAKFSPDGSILATGSIDGTVRLWRTESGQPSGWPLRHPGDVSSIAFSGDGTMVASATSAGSARLWRVTAEQYDSPKRLEHEGRVLALAVAAQSQDLIVTGSADGTARLWSATDASLRMGPWQQPSEVLSVAMSGDAKLVAIGSSGATRGSIEIRDTATGDVVGSVLRSHAPLTVLALDPTGTLVAAGTRAGTIQIWEIATGKRRGSLLRHKASTTDIEITALAFSPDGTQLASGCLDKTVLLWTVPAGKPAGLPLWHDGRVEALAFSPDGRRLATASSDLTIRFWDVPTGALLPQTIRPPVGVQHLAFGPTGKLLATASVDGACRLWDLETGLACGLPFMHETFATAVSFSPDERSLISGSFDKSVRVWSLPRHLGDSDFKSMQLRTWVALGARLGPHGTAEAIPWQEWRKMHEELARRDGPSQD